jgi:hypothetical protein
MIGTNLCGAGTLCVLAAVPGYFGLSIANQIPIAPPLDDAQGDNLNVLLSAAFGGTSNCVANPEPAAAAGLGRAAQVLDNVFKEF